LGRRRKRSEKAAEGPKREVKRKERLRQREKRKMLKHIIGQIKILRTWTSFQVVRITVVPTLA